MCAFVYACMCVVCGGVFTRKPYDLLGVNALEHGRVLENIRDDNKSDEGTAYKHLLQTCYRSVPPRHSNVCHAAVHVVFCLLQRASIQLPPLKSKKFRKRWESKKRVEEAA